MRLGPRIVALLGVASCTAEKIPPFLGDQEDSAALLDYLQNTAVDKVTLKPGRGFKRLHELNITVANFFDKKWRCANDLEDPRWKFIDSAMEDISKALKKNKKAQQGPSRADAPEEITSLFGELPEGRLKVRRGDKKPKHYIDGSRSHYVDVDGGKRDEPSTYRPWRQLLTRPAQPQCWSGTDKQWDANYGGLRLCYDFIMYQRLRKVLSYHDERVVICEAVYEGRRTRIVGQTIESTALGAASGYAKHVAKGLEWLLLSCPRIQNCSSRSCALGGMNSMWDNGDYTLVVVGDDYNVDKDKVPGRDYI